MDKNNKSIIKYLEMLFYVPALVHIKNSRSYEVSQLIHFHINPSDYSGFSYQG